MDSANSSGMDKMQKHLERTRWTALHYLRIGMNARAEFMATNQRRAMNRPNWLQQFQPTECVAASALDGL
jgi:hypothetical protein